jgi:hypothetical protein
MLVKRTPKRTIYANKRPEADPVSDLLLRPRERHESNDTCGGQQATDSSQGWDDISSDPSLWSIRQDEKSVRQNKDENQAANTHKEDAVKKNIKGRRKRSADHPHDEEAWHRYDQRSPEEPREFDWRFVRVVVPFLDIHFSLEP